MRGIVLNLVLFVWSVVGFTQKAELWKESISAKISISKLGESEGTLLLNGSVRKILEANPKLKILRSFDRMHHITRGTFNGIEADHYWSVSNEWKLSLKESRHVDHYYVVVTELFNFDLQDSFEIVRFYESSNTYLIKGKWSKVEEILIPHPEVIHITDKVNSPSVESRVIDMNLNPNRVNKIHHSYPDLNGSTEVVSIQENRFDESDIDLLGRSLASGLESETTNSHATEMATIIAGAGNSFITGRGVANRVTITSSDFLDAMPDSDQSYAELGVLTQNHSYGIPRSSDYGVEARAFDQSSVANKSLLHIFSSGNEGREVSSDGIYSGIEGFANLTGNIKMTKNSLVVGSVDTVGNIPSFVSRGPAYDGRVKPEVVTYSAVGSSNSAALASGISILLQQQYRQGNGGAEMPSALTKALLINGADDVGPTGLDYLTGYGNINAWKSLQMLQNLQYASGTVANNEIETLTLTLPANAVNLKVTLCWTDPAANIGDFPALVNNLDLRVTDGVDTILPWVLDASPNVENLSKQATRSVDELNNVEQVTIPNPSTSYTIEIEGADLLTDQDYFIAWEYELSDSFEWDYPTGSDNMPYNGESGSYFRWDTTKDGIGELSYSIDGIDWIVLDAAVELKNGYWRWNNPPMLNNSIRARMTIGMEVFETDIFTVSEPLQASLGFNCADSLMLRWDRSQNADEYAVSRLGDDALEEFAITSDTFLIIPNVETLPDTRFSIKPRLINGEELLPTPTFDYTLQGVGCYVSSFFQSVALDTGIYLNLRLGTTYGIDEIVFERNDIISGYTQIANLSEMVLVSEEISILDGNPNQGYNEHRATIRFINGEELTLSAGSTFYLTEIPVRVFPNPVSSGEPITIITKEFADRTPLLELIDQRGALIHSQEVQGSQDNIPTIGFEPGIYYYRLNVDGQALCGRILIR
ncbi:Por secretion system C-terminal sorting domain-containing protein [Ekhidna lutea]|uniref:Por secretion system C-terminal sorting domain-containing protein n=1 Tax=Ekhidna lutea TaxID=447679 RepID=A0A239M2P3_EKHLU|nr:S8 family peptidase [Ekhidna lutea]SNT36860.1 Por secretion system C-terminal sorting domain-containing protein [Ekhidna lutea]